MTGHSLVKISEDLKYYRSVFCLAGFCLFLSFALMREVCLLNRGSVRSEGTRDKKIFLTKEESIYAIKVEKDSQRWKRLCSKKLKSVNFRVLADWNLSIPYDNRFSWFSAVILIFLKTNLISFSYLLRPSNWQSLSEIDFLTLATISLIFTGNHS